MYNQKASELAKRGRLIALTGYSGSGKDTCTNAARNDFDIKRLSFSDQLKRSACKVFPLLERDYPPETKNTQCLSWTTKSPREIWNYFDFMNEVDPYGFARLLCEELEQSDNEYYIITDVRKPGEYEFIKENDIPLVHIYTDRQVFLNDKDKHVEFFSRNSNLTYSNNKDDNGVNFVTFLEDEFNWRK